ADSRAEPAMPSGVNAWAFLLTARTTSAPTASPTPSHSRRRIFSPDHLAARRARRRCFNSSRISASSAARRRLAAALRTPYESAATLINGLDAAAATTVDTFATLAVTCCTWSVIVSSRASWTLTLSSDTWVCPSEVLTFSIVALTLPRIGPVASATSRSVRVAWSTVCRNRRIGTIAGLATNARAPDRINNAISQPRSCMTRLLRPHGTLHRRRDTTVSVGAALRDRPVWVPNSRGRRGGQPGKARWSAAEGGRSAGEGHPVEDLGRRLGRRAGAGRR